MLKRFKTKAGNTKESKEDQASKEFMDKIAQMTTEELQKTSERLLKIIEESENTENVIAAMSQNRAIIFELLSRNQHES